MYVHTKLQVMATVVSDYQLWRTKCEVLTNTDVTYLQIKVYRTCWNLVISSDSLAVTFLSESVVRYFEHNSPAL